MTTPAIFFRSFCSLITTSIGWTLPFKNYHKIGWNSSLSATAPSISQTSNLILLLGVSWLLSQITLWTSKKLSTKWSSAPKKSPVSVMSPSAGRVGASFHWNCQAVLLLYCLARKNNKFICILKSKCRTTIEKLWRLSILKPVRPVGLRTWNSPTVL